MLAEADPHAVDRQKELYFWGHSYAVCFEGIKKPRIFSVKIAELSVSSKDSFKLLLLIVMFLVLAVEFIHASGSIDKFHLTCKERM